ncbi:MAG TPA: sigma-70 family RNA polymerase sigma factor [Ktedonobacterales bacterium]
MRVSDPPASSVAEFSPEAFVDLLDRCQWALFSFLRGIVGDEEQARDLMQDTFYHAWRAAQRGLPPFDGDDEAGMRRWLFHVAYNRAISVLRRRRLIQWLPLESVTLSIVFEDQLAEGQAVRAALATLSAADAACLLLIIVQGFTAAEAGQIIGASPQAVAKRLSRAKQRLRDAYLAQNPRPEERTRL